MFEVKLNDDSKASSKVRRNVRHLEDISNIHNDKAVAFDSCQLVILKTPNRILNNYDIPPLRFDGIVSDNVAYPNEDYTLRWLTLQTENILVIAQNNLNALSRNTPASTSCRSCCCTTTMYCSCQVVRIREGSPPELRKPSLYICAHASLSSAVKVYT